MSIIENVTILPIKDPLPNLSVEISNISKNQRASLNRTNTTSHTGKKTEKSKPKFEIKSLKEFIILFIVIIAVFFAYNNFN